MRHEKPTPGSRLDNTFFTSTLDILYDCCIFLDILLFLFPHLEWQIVLLCLFNNICSLGLGIVAGRV